MNFIKLLPAILSFLLLAAHFYRSGQLFLVGISLFMIAMLAFRHIWVHRVIQAALILGSVEWLHTLYRIIQVRTDHGMPWTRLTLILGAVALLTALSALVFKGSWGQSQVPE